MEGRGREGRNGDGKGANTVTTKEEEGRMVVRGMRCREMY